MMLGIHAVPEQQRPLVASLIAAGIHMHQDWDDNWRVVGLKKTRRPFELCGTPKCFRLKLRNVRPE